MHRRSSRVKNPQSRLSNVLKRLYRRWTCLTVKPMMKMIRLLGDPKALQHFF
jgi:hypothetical protein